MISPRPSGPRHTTTRRWKVGGIHVHEFMSLDGVIDAPTWTFDYGFDARMGEAIGAVTAQSKGILLGRTTYEMFEPAWSTRTADDDPGAPFFNDTTKLRRLGDAHNSELAELGARRRLRRRCDPQLEGQGRRRSLRERQRHARAGVARRRPGRRAASVRLPAHAQGRPAALHGGRFVTPVLARRTRVVRQRRSLRSL